MNTSERSAPYQISHRREVAILGDPGNVRYLNVSRRDKNVLTTKSLLRPRSFYKNGEGPKWELGVPEPQTLYTADELRREVVRPSASGNRLVMNLRPLRSMAMGRFPSGNGFRIYWVNLARLGREQPTPRRLALRGVRI